MKKSKPTDANLFVTEDGSHSIYSEKHGVSYHSKYGALQETLHVFIDAALKFKSATSQQLSILEIGFGTGLNALATLAEANAQHLVIDYVAVEAYPISMTQAEQLNYGDLLEMEDHFLKMHAAPWETPVQLSSQFTIEKVLTKFEHLDYENQFDIVYFDAFAPDAQPELWGKSIMTKMYKALRPNGVLVTYCAKGIVKRTLKSVGFAIEAIPGPPGKREMTRALKIAET